jgi:preprotein translocase subunit SecY
MLETIRNAWSIPELRKKIIYTFSIILVFRIGSNIPVPFIDTAYLQRMGTDGSFLGYLNILSGGAFMNAALFALGISPYITASIILQLLTVAIPALERLAKEGADGRKKLNKITRWATAVLAIVQAVAFYILNRNLGAVAWFPTAFGRFFIGLVIVMSFAAGAMLIVWLGESIDRKGVGNGISIILFAGIVSSGPHALRYLWMLLTLGGRYYVLVPIIVLIFLFLIFAIVHMTNAERRIPLPGWN